MKRLKKVIDQKQLSHYKRRSNMKIPKMLNKKEEKMGRLSRRKENRANRLEKIPNKDKHPVN